MKLSEAITPFLNHCHAERHVAASTLAKYQECFDCWLSPCLGEKDLKDISRLDVLDLRKAMTDRHLSIARQYSIVMCLKTFLRFARFVIGVPCLDPAGIPLPKRPAPEVVYLDNDEVRRMLDAINVNTFAGIRLRALVELLLSTGMRISEALSLKREVFDVDCTEAEIVGKGKRKRHIFFSRRCRVWVQQYLDRRVDDDPALFVTTGYPVRKFQRADVSRFFSNLRRAAELQKRLTPHVLRHTYCTNLRNNGADISHIKDLAGHQSIHTTARYYLGKDKNILRQVVDNCLRYEPAEAHRNSI